MSTTSELYRFIVHEVLPRLPGTLKEQFTSRYPHISLQQKDGFRPLMDMQLTMLVALTGTGKSTALLQLDKLRRSDVVQYRDDVPSRRELADLIVIPTAQHIRGEALRPIQDRVERFSYTHYFTERLEPGGFATIYTWLYHQSADNTPRLSEGIRGPKEIEYVLVNCPQWRVIELWADALTRLQRLTARRDTFDHVQQDQTVDWSFLPEDDRPAAYQMLASGAITTTAIITAGAEARNYGTAPYRESSNLPVYRLIRTESRTPEEIATEIAGTLHADA